jgi:phosphoribosylformylglycinamidine synthase
MNKRIFIERKIGFDIEKIELAEFILKNYGVNVPSLRYFIVYDLFDFPEDLIEDAVDKIFHETNRDMVCENLPKAKHIISYESLPGQFDQRADSAIQCVKLLSPNSDVSIRCAIAITIDENLDENIILKLKKTLINPVESREKNLLEMYIPNPSNPSNIEIINNFILMNSDELEHCYNNYNLAMSFEDFQFIQSYFVKEDRNPYETEIRVLDTYWSDHCRHTTFETELTEINFDTTELGKEINQAFLSYLEDRRVLKRDSKPITLMDIATVNAKKEFHKGNLNDLEISEEINAASIYIDVDVNGVTEKWLLMFKNETHNHPTEIEPFGGASTCIGGAIRDPLSGRSYVYQAMRVTGASDITEKMEDTIIGKLPQQVISKESAHGYSSYGNQIGLATTFVDEIYHDGYKAKRMEIGAVVGAVKASHVRRESPSPGDSILLLGGKTGRDGIGGATGSSKEHTVESIELSGAEVQKGNAPEERKIQRLFRNPNVTKLIKKSNDFGAGGVSVAIGELADGLRINLDNIPTKYEGMNGTELAISESQERMAVVIDPSDVQEFMKYCENENIEVTKVATVTDEKRLVMTWRNNIICDMSREFLDTAGVRQKNKVQVECGNNTSILENKFQGENLKTQIYNMLHDKNIASKQGLEEMFDATIGRTTVLSPYGGKYKLTKAQSSVHKIPVLNNDTNTVSIMTYGFNPYISEKSPYHGSTYAIIDSMAKVVACGGDYQKIRFTFQEYFPRLNKDSKLWGLPFQSLLGAYKTLSAFQLSAIGGKDSMSGTYHDLTVPPTLVSFAVTTEHINQIISPEFKMSENYVYLIDYLVDELELPNFNELQDNFSFVNNQIKSKEIISAYALGYGGMLEAIIKMSFGNKIGCDVEINQDMFEWKYGSIIVESTKKLTYKNAKLLGKTIKENNVIVNGLKMSIDDLISQNYKRYSEIYPPLHKDSRELKNVRNKNIRKDFKRIPKQDVNVLIPVFPGTNCEYDCEKAFVKEGATVKTLVFNNQDESHINDSINALVEAINHSDILMLAGGFSSGDEPDGSGKFIATVLRNDKVKKAIETFLKNQNLILGICNGFQALVKSGLLPNGTIENTTEQSATLFKNSINRHISKFVNTKVSSVNSPWLSSFSLDEVHTIPMSHGEGKFILTEAMYQELLENDQIAFQYVDDLGNPTYNPIFNPNGSSYAIEGIVSKDGLILGKMGHSERYEEGLFKNITGNKSQNIFRNGVEFIRKGRTK